MTLHHLWCLRPTTHQPLQLTSSVRTALNDQKSSFSARLANYISSCKGPGSTRVWWLFPLCLLPVHKSWIHTSMAEPAHSYCLHSKAHTPLFFGLKIIYITANLYVYKWQPWIIVLVYLAFKVFSSEKKLAKQNSNGYLSPPNFHMLKLKVTGLTNLHCLPLV